ncbi:P2X purinoceptor 4-like [Paramuricea clavata]|uniref:P2X purinoceptor 4-like n=1 Tax=Paramuricea clavata TaxID=317549 RepID=A0A6S7GW70_PARCT|nr:P2X purinoceptor 4-like [Paramuricea clavata]
MVNFYKIGNSVASALFEYNTSKIVHINSKKVGFVNRLIQLLIIGYVIGYAIIYKKGYQKFDVGLSSVTTKVKGVVQTNLSINYPIRVENKTTWGVFNQGPRTWDSADYVTPAEEYEAVFVMTNMILTPEQKQGKCPEDYAVREAMCTNDSDCVARKVPKNGGHGIMTGKCIESDRPHAVSKMCEIETWCPVENNKLPMQGTNFGKPLSNKTCLFEEAINFTISLKNTVRFPEFGVTVRNIDDEHNDKDYLSKCEYNHKDQQQRLCPKISLKTIFDEISGTAFNDTAIRGGVVGIKITWDCNLDYDKHKCLPRYSFFRLDNPLSKVSPGYNVRIAQYDMTDKKFARRTLIKAYGIRFVIMVDAQAGKFDIVPLLRNFGAGLGLLTLATVLCDICVLYCLKKKSYYRSQKYLYVDSDQDENQASA